MATSDYDNPILFIQMGGTIDKAYPRSSGGYSFEIGDPAVEKVLAKIKPSLGLPKFKVKTVCTKDSQEVNSVDRYVCNFRLIIFGKVSKIVKC